MREDGGPDGGDDGPAPDEQAHESDDVGYWDETILGKTASDADAEDGGSGGTDEDDDGPSGNVAGEFRPSAPVEPGTPDPENALFVVLGAYVAVVGLTRLFVDQGGFSGQDLLVLTAGVVLVSVVFLGFFGVLTPDT